MGFEAKPKLEEFIILNRTLKRSLNDIYGRDYDYKLIKNCNLILNDQKYNQSHTKRLFLTCFYI